MVYRNKSLVGYSVRRPMTLWGKKREIGEFIPVKEVASLARIEAFVRSGRFNQVFVEGGQRIERSRGGAKIRVIANPEPPEVTEAAEAAEVIINAESEASKVEEFAPKKTTAKKAAAKKVG